MKNVDLYLANALVSLHWIFITVAESSPIAGMVNFKIPLLDPILLISSLFLMRNLASCCNGLWSNKATLGMFKLASPI